MPSLSNGVEVCYLYHFSQPYHHAQHYVGSTANWKKRHKQHLSGKGSPLIKAALSAGISLELAWLQLGGAEREKEIKRQKNSKRFCPLCGNANVLHGDSNKNE